MTKVFLLKFKITINGNGHMITLKRTPKTHLVVATHTFFKLHQILGCGRHNIIYPNSLRIWCKGSRPASALSCIMGKQECEHRCDQQCSHGFWWSCISIFPSFSVILDQSMVYRMFSKDLSAQCCLQVFHNFHYFYYILSCSQSSSY